MIQTLFSVKTKLWENFITAITKTIEIFHLHSSKGIKKTISQTYLMKTWKDIKRTWKGVESLVSITPSLITKDEKYINDPVSIANTFNNLFTSGAETVHSKTKFSNKLFRNFLPS